MNKKFIFLLTLTFGMVLSSNSFAYSDVSGHWAEETINNASSIGIINGYADNSFRPDASMTRAELITVLNRLIGLESETDKYIPDITRQDWFYTNMKRAVNAGIIEGDNKGLVKPNDNVTREQAVLIISRAFRIKNEGLSYTSFEDDASISSWAKPEFLTFVRKQYITGYKDNTLKPQNSISRAEILTILNRVLKNIPINGINSLKVNGNVLIKDAEISINNSEIFGDLIIGEKATKTVALNNVIINGNLVLYGPIDLGKNVVAVNGDIIKIYENNITSSLYYLNPSFGIKFPLPDGANAFDKSIENKDDYDKQDLIIVNIRQDNEYYYKNISELSLAQINLLEYDSIYEKIEDGKIKSYSYELYTDNATSHFLVIKRDNIVYTILFLNIVSDNIIDSIIANIEFMDGANTPIHKDMIYKNSKLCLKFSYKEGYVGVDDSYNTGNIYTGDSVFKLFIQVNMITDIDEYSINEVTTLLKTLIKSDGKIVDEKLGKINNHDTILFEIESEEDKIMCLYVIIGNNLYNFIFKGDINKMDSIGKEMFQNIVNSMEF